MITMQLFHDVLLTLAVLIGLTIALSAVMLIAPALSKPARPSRPPRGGLRRDLPWPPEPEPRPEPQLQLDAEEDRERELMLV
jgi:hypothetical protein